MKNKTILEYLRKTNKAIEAPCNGHGICGKCKVMIEPAIKPNHIDLEFLTKDEIDQGIRLACTHNMTEELTVTVSKQSMMRINSAFTQEYQIEPYIKAIPNGETYDIYRKDTIIDSLAQPLIYGIGIDIGTTTIVLVLIDLHYKKVIDKITFSNPQRQFGNDIISRIEHAKTKEGLDELHQLIKDTINSKIIHLLQINQVSLDVLYEVVIASNSTMNHLLLNIDPTPLARAPFISKLHRTLTRSYQSLFNEPLNATVTLIGNASAYIGGDIISGIYATEAINKQQTTLFVDLGTNGEIALIHQHKILATSVAAGPAFEGVNIQCGMGAIEGAIYAFDSLKNYQTVNQVKAKGICGSGLIDLISVLKIDNKIDRTGKIMETFHITSNVFLSQKDVREFQLAKAAIRAGVEQLLNVLDLTPNNINQVIVSGGFGSYINLKHFYRLGILPNVLEPITRTIGNSSLSGTIKYLMTSENNLESVRSNIEVLNLSTSISFQEDFVKYMHFKT